MDKAAFETFLRRSGRSPSAAARCISYVHDFEQYLHTHHHGRTLDEAGGTELERFVAAIQCEPKASARTRAILEYVKLSDLARISGSKGIRARLYYDAGVDSLENLATWDPVELRTMLLDFVERTGFDGIAPLPKEAASAVATAKRLPKLVEY